MVPVLRMAAKREPFLLRFWFPRVLPFFNEHFCSFFGLRILVYFENRSLGDGMQEKFSSGDNLMSLQLKKVAGKIVEGVFWAENGDCVFGEFWFEKRSWQLISERLVLYP
jgi:hypothetical protein